MKQPKLFLITHDFGDGKSARVVCSLAAEAADHALVPATCGCGATPIKVQGANRRPSADDRAWESDAITMCCSKLIGVLRLETNTLFGVREDMAVLQGRCRVY